jgi:fatty acid CoA ligase FadD9
MSAERSDEATRARALERYRGLLDRDPELLRSAPSHEALEQIRAEGRSSVRAIALACELYADRPCLGERAFVVEDGQKRLEPAFRNITYGEVWQRVQALASGLRRLGLCEPGAMVGISGFASIDWVVADLTCLYLAAVSIPLPTIATAAQLRPIATETGLSCVVCSLAQLEVVAATLPAAGSVRAVVVMDVCEEDRAQADALAAARQSIDEQGGCVTVRTMAEVERLGREVERPVPPVEPLSDDVLRTIVYTSGSTGTPKGAMFPERIWALYWQRPWDVGLADVAFITVGYMPLNHMAGRLTLLRSLTSGGLMSFPSTPDLSTLFEDIRIVRPTSLLAVPRVASMIYQHYQTEVIRRGATGRDVENEVIDEMRRTFLGDRLINLGTGSAPTAYEVTSFLGRCFDVPVIDGYGSTELGGIALDGRIDNENVVAYRLVDVPELGYTASDRPHPRGELRVKAHRMVPGYYRNPDATRELFDADGYLVTGDIVEQRGRDEIAWIDRRKNVLKLSQGEFVSVSRLEELFAAGSPFIRQVYLHGTSLWSYLLAVVVPHETTDKALLRREIERIAEREGLRGWEIPRDFIVETAPFTQQSGLLTESGKPARPKLRERYGDRLERMHQEIERRSLDELRALASQAERPAAEKVARVFALTLGLSEREVRESDQSFLKLGGDSLGAVQLVARIQQVCGVDLPVSLVLNPTSSVGALVRAVEERLAGRGPARRVTFAEVHGAGAEILRAEDLRIDKFIAADELATAGSSPRTGPPVVVLTGANGFLGRYLLLELLERLAPSRGKVVAIVRARDDAAARDRLAASYAGVDARLPARFETLAAEQGRLEAIAGDLILPRLGLTEELWNRLALEVTAIVHPGALVNHSFSYSQLFEPNVLGTIEVMRLALRRRAPIGLVSSIGVAAGLDRSDPVREDEDAAALWPRHAVDSGYAVGYAASKWADELLARDFQASTGVPVCVFRSSMIMPPRTFVGQVNAADLLTRLLHSVIVTGLAPRSFYADTAKRPHFDGLPVDVVARAIAAVSLAAHAGYEIFHTVDGHFGDGISLDTYVDWAQRAGYPVRRIDDHAAWYRAIRGRLEALAPEEQQRSALPILKAWERPAVRELALDNRRLCERLRALGEQSDMPSIDEQTIRRYLESMVALGLIRSPEPPRPATHP